MVLNTALVLGAVAVHAALNGLTADIGIATEAARAGTRSLVVGCLAERVHSARVVHQAGVDAPVVVADLVVPTVLVDDALHYMEIKGKLIITSSISGNGLSVE